MKLEKQPSDVKITFSPDEFFLVKCKENLCGDYALHYRIDRSYKGKDDDIGMERLYLDKEEAKVFRDAGFIEYII